MRFLTNVCVVSTALISSCVSSKKQDEVFVNLKEIKIAGTIFPCVNQKLIDGKFADATNAFNKVMKMAIPNKGSAYNGATNISNEYKKDRINGRYDCFVGFEVESFKGLGKDVQTMTIPAQKYRLFKTAKGPMQKVLFETWSQKIWPNEKLNKERAFIADFERYTGKEDFNKAEIEIYVGVK